MTAYVVEQNGAFVAALPLVRTNLRGLYPIYELPVNCWANCGDLLVDRQADMQAVVEVLLDGLAASGLWLAMFDEVPLESPQWKAARNAFQRRGCEVRVSGEHPVGVIDILHDWERYQASWSSNHRCAIGRSLRKLEKRGEVTVQRYRDPSNERLVQLMQEAFEIENRSWKGENQSSILTSPGMSEYMIEEAKECCAPRIPRHLVPLPERHADCL